MTEKEAWLKIAEMFDSGKRLPWLNYDLDLRVVGLCHGTLYLRKGKQITAALEERMDGRMYNLFDYPDREGCYLWPKSGRDSCKPRATACGFLAAMCND